MDPRRARRTALDQRLLGSRLCRAAACRQAAARRQAPALQSKYQEATVLVQAVAAALASPRLRPAKPSAIKGDVLRYIDLLQRVDVVLKRGARVK